MASCDPIDPSLSRLVCPSLLSQSACFLLLIHSLRSSFAKNTWSDSSEISSTVQTADVCSSVHNIHQKVFKVSSLRKGLLIHKNCSKVTGWETLMLFSASEFSVMIFPFVLVNHKMHSKGPICPLFHSGSSSGASLDLVSQLQCLWRNRLLITEWVKESIILFFTLERWHLISTSCWIWKLILVTFCGHLLHILRTVLIDVSFFLHTECAFATDLHPSKSSLFL